MGNPDLNKLAEVAPDVRRISTKEAEANFEPVKIIKHAGNAILVSEEVWRGLTETLNLVSIPGMRGSIRSGMREPLAVSAEGLD
jgi:antitoxin YefM